MSADGAAPRDGARGLTVISSIGSVAQLAGAIPGALRDIRAIAEGMRYLPELVATLTAIEKRTDSMDEEVIKMRRAVESLNSGLDELKGRVGDLEPYLADMRRSLRPLRRAAGRLGLARGDKTP